ncbi:D-arabinose 1-dehydrogenase-like Zn-dependent alcohol dehydrogenase [Granulicella aggregans]|uniref:D-arabinose 1-dehydrogenase-like Zn-dependent alcohol dehydrogenase n=1 Tax=Granulicella aggregans TaxID=474949 RepID=A0A7W7ZG86_9BACT|nr:D-arabinose 1-dehydrogenase-like Zn-dependent alcohol dehydrogenase [Granulicella aggregans]
MTVPAHSLVLTPAHLSDAEAATIPIAATTAWRAVRSAALGPHKTALLLGHRRSLAFCATVCQGSRITCHRYVVF